MRRLSNVAWFTGLMALSTVLAILCHCNFHVHSLLYKLMSLINAVMGFFDGHSWIPVIRSSHSWCKHCYCVSSYVTSSHYYNQWETVFTLCNCSTWNWHDKTTRFSKSMMPRVNSVQFPSYPAMKVPCRLLKYLSFCHSFFGKLMMSAL